MNAKDRKNESALGNIIVLVIFMACLIGAALLAMLPNSTHALSLPHTLGGDCTADRAAGDIYPQPWNDMYCKTATQGQGQDRVRPYIDPDRPLDSIRLVEDEPIPTQVPTQVPAPTITSTPAPDPIVTPAPTQDNVPVKHDQPKPTKEVKAKHPNKGNGNGSEGADPGNHPEKGNEDEPVQPKGNGNGGDNGQGKGKNK